MGVDPNKGRLQDVEEEEGVGGGSGVGGDVNEVSRNAIK